jgi:predicted nucleic acid-binding protein
VRSFLDTNVVVYAFDVADPNKQQKALSLLTSDERLVVSTQVLLETWWTLTRKLATRMTEEQAQDVLDQLCLLPVVQTDVALVQQAVTTCRKYTIALWDALIIEAARSGGCHRVYSEDLQHHQFAELSSRIHFNPRPRPRGPAEKANFYCGSRYGTIFEIFAHRKPQRKYNYAFGRIGCRRFSSL